MGFRTTLHKIKAHTNIQGNDLADAATKLAGNDFDKIPPIKKIRVDIREIAPRPTLWDMYTTKLLVPDPALSIGTNRATLRRPWWTIPEADRLQVHAFTRPSQRLRLEVCDALLRTLHHSSLYMRLIVANKKKGVSHQDSGTNPPHTANL